MPEFEKFVARHGEFGVQAIIEGLEKFLGIGTRLGQPLEERWVALMQNSSNNNEQTGASSCNR